MVLAEGMGFEWGSKQPPQTWLGLGENSPRKKQKAKTLSVTKRGKQR
jgi:hypothetical protein